MMDVTICLSLATKDVITSDPFNRNGVANLYTVDFFELKIKIIIKWNNGSIFAIV